MIRHQIFISKDSKLRYGHLSFEFFLVRKNIDMTMFYTNKNGYLSERIFDV